MKNRKIRAGQAGTASLAIFAALSIRPLGSINGPV
jgi:hypothetical protein